MNKEMNKEKYEKPVIRKVELDEASIIYASGPVCESDGCVNVTN